jgi:exodeoxyribonuclease I
MTQFNGNRRGDVMRLAQFASVVDPGALRVPIIRGRATFKLAPLAAANGFVGHAAHDALGDVRATVHLLRVIRSQAPNASALFPALVSKTGVVDALLDAEFAVLVSHFGVAVAKPVLPICPNPAYPAQWVSVRARGGKSAVSARRAECPLHGARRARERKVVTGRVR